MNTNNAQFPLERPSEAAGVGDDVVGTPTTRRVRRSEIDGSYMRCTSVRKDA